MPPALREARGAFRRRRPARTLLRAPAWCAALRWPAGAVAARVHRCSSRTPTRPLFVRCSRAPSRPHALPRLLQVYVSASTTVDHWNIPTRRGRRLGRLPARPKVAFRRISTEGNRRRYAGSGVENNRVSTLPVLIAQAGDFAPTPIASGHLLSRASAPVPLSGATWGGRDAAIAAHRCNVCAARGSCDARLPRRRRTFTNPRSLPSRGRSRCELGGSRGAAGAVRRSRLRLFHHLEARAGDARTGFR